MKSTEVEQWVYRVLARLERGARVEDDLVECKRQLPSDHFKAARRIAGHANQVRDDRILWVVGVDEDARPNVVGLPDDHPDAADWWPRVRASFDDVSPDPLWINLDVDGKSILALGFETPRRPYVVRWSLDSPNREVPWREATFTRSATRSDLLKLLVPLSSRPSVTVLDGEVGVRELRVTSPSSHASQHLYWDGVIQIYLDCNESIVIPDHRCEAILRLSTDLEVDMEIRLSPPSGDGGPNAQIHQGYEQVVVRGSTQMALLPTASTSVDDMQRVIDATRASLDVRMTTAGPDQVTIAFSVELLAAQPSTRTSTSVARWTTTPDA